MIEQGKKLGIVFNQEGIDVTFEDKSLEQSVRLSFGSKKPLGPDTFILQHTQPGALRSLRTLLRECSFPFPGQKELLGLLVDQLDQIVRATDAEVNY